MEVDPTDRWTSVFSEFKPARDGKPAKDTQTVAGEMARKMKDPESATYWVSTERTTGRDVGGTRG
ncbi:hypothetical protein [Streptomyces sp. NPDC013187]|uniref:hypothetical protein n=1 Tax=Streptomyces sp. NPDC013187 TaxID=3364865 RepID=UPI0036AD6933